MSAFYTRDEIVSGVVTELGLSSGSAVQIYTEDQIDNKILSAFHTLAEKRFWPHLMKNTEHTPDGTTGKITDSLTYIRDVDDIEWIREYPYNACNKVRYLAGEPYSDNYNFPAYDTLPWDDTDYEDKLIQLYPITTETNIMIRARRRPVLTLGADQIIPLDGIMLTHFITAMLYSSDGINPEGQTIQWNLFDQRYNDLVSNKGREMSYFNQRHGADSFTVAP